MHDTRNSYRPVKSKNPMSGFQNPDLRISEQTSHEEVSVKVGGASEKSPRPLPSFQRLALNAEPKEMFISESSDDDKPDSVVYKDENPYKSLVLGFIGEIFFSMFGFTNFEQNDEIFIQYGVTDMNKFLEEEKKYKKFFNYDILDTRDIDLGDGQSI